MTKQNSLPAPSNKIYFGNNAEGTNPHIHATIERSIAITNADPKLDLVDHTANTKDFRIGVTGNKFYLKSNEGGALDSTANFLTIDSF